MKSSEELRQKFVLSVNMMQRAYARRTIFDIFHPGNSSVSPNPNFAVAKSLSFAVAISYSFFGNVFTIKFKSIALCFAYFLG